MTVDPGTGAIASIYDKDLARELVDSQAAHKVNQLVVKWVQTGKQESPIATETRVGQEGPVCVSLVATAAGVGCPQVAQEVVLYEGIKRIDLFNRVLKDSTPLQEVYFAFPFKVDEPKFRFEGSNSVIEPFKDQFPRLEHELLHGAALGQRLQREHRRHVVRGRITPAGVRAAFGLVMSRRPTTA